MAVIFANIICVSYPAAKRTRDTLDNTHLCNTVFRILCAEYYPLLAKTKGLENITYQKLNKAYADFHGHKPHDGRKTFITLAKKYNVDEYAIKYIVGHSISDLTELDWLREEIAKIKVHAEVTKSVGTV